MKITTETRQTYELWTFATAQSNSSTLLKIPHNNNNIKCPSKTHVKQSKVETEKRTATANLKFSRTLWSCEGLPIPFYTRQYIRNNHMEIVALCPTGSYKKWWWWHRNLGRSYRGWDSSAVWKCWSASIEKRKSWLNLQQTSQLK